MLPESGTITRSELEARVLQKAWDDPEFKKRLIANPRKALAQMKIFYQPDVKYHVVAERPGVGYLVLPWNPAAPLEESDYLLEESDNLLDESDDPLELSDEELEMIAAGFPPNCQFEPMGSKC